MVKTANVYQMLFYTEVEDVPVPLAMADSKRNKDLLATVSDVLLSQATMGSKSSFIFRNNDFSEGNTILNSGCESILHKESWFPKQRSAHGYSQLQHSILFLFLWATWP